MVQLKQGSSCQNCTAYNKGLCRFILYKLYSFQYSASEMFVANNVDFLDVLIRKSLHRFYTCLVM